MRDHSLEVNAGVDIYAAAVVVLNVESITTDIINPRSFGSFSVKYRFVHILVHNGPERRIEKVRSVIVYE
jgi:hypothetical protein